MLWSLGIPLRWWAGALAHAADLLLETMLGTAAWHSLMSHPERLFEGVGVNAGVMQNCPVARYEGSDEGGPSEDDAHRPLAKIGATIKEHGRMPDASAVAEASTLQACAVARKVATGWVERSQGDFAEITSPQATRRQCVLPGTRTSVGPSNCCSLSPGRMKIPATDCLRGIGYHMSRHSPHRHPSIVGGRRPLTAATPASPSQRTRTPPDPAFRPRSSQSQRPE
ncbi:unannotated protein [freshwater metagenome]|uniref:Unannotated protein n=1 Tax=freshwater metagenome TaxID=449393 RepID=A0A6J7LT09_9ZZZZ